ncbi:hypothetical protein N7478_005155 [Penicillium angulare]|uniref:uncharacterized protein n=1 Tax=Penicillium angulare TaxID=116970 RepID=UPI00254218D9|nr:uncharacterized protein N7478_005155 [Penicillium angulare]KAJ5279783.1 hypothetical protein N7478_005155 [Penicillium angulare]
MILNGLIWLSVIKLASADWQFLSRPDLAPPKLNITVPASSQTESGYIFVSLKTGGIEGSVGPEQPAPYIFRDNGDLVWSGVGYYSGYVIDFGVVSLNGTPVLRAFQGSIDAPHVRMNGHHAILNNRYQTVRTIQAASHRLSSGHEFNVIDGKSALIEIGLPVLTDLSAYGGDEEQQWIISSGFQEIDIQTSELIFEWYSFGHISPEYSHLSLESDGPYSGRSAFDAWSYFAINSIDKDDEGNYLISSRQYSAIFKINGTSGKIIWQLGGLNGSDFDIPAHLKFSFQHDARLRYCSPDGSIERISFFDNSNSEAQPEHRTGIVAKTRYIELNHNTKTVSEIWTHIAPDGLIATSQGNIQFLPNGNTFTGWGQAGAITEFSSEGKILFHAYLDSNPNKFVQSYRGFRSNWTGNSSEDPAVLALRDEDGRVSIWVSWNGDTETKTWRFHLHEYSSGLNVNFLGAQTRERFETQYDAGINGSLETLQKYSVVAEALNFDGETLGRSRPVRIQDDTPYRAHIARLEHRKNREMKYQQGRMEL